LPDRFDIRRILAVAVIDGRGGCFMEASATIIPIASGKGGVGKTFVTANLAMALAELGHSTVAVDLDLGGSNLNSFMGLPNRFPGIGDYLNTPKGELTSLLVPTHLPQLKLLPGDGKTPFMANIPYARKIKLLSAIQKLPADYILLDLGAGSSYNTLDFFGIAEKGMIVTSPSAPAILNMMVFLKNYLLRSIEKKFPHNNGVKTLIQGLSCRPMSEQMASIETLRREIMAEDPTAEKVIAEICGGCRPRVIFNFGEHPDQLQVADQISKNLTSILSIEADYFGFVFYDEAVRLSVFNPAKRVVQSRECPAVRSVYQIAKRIEKFWDRKVQDSARRLKMQILEHYEAGG
jgi:flagellar biosynthesis protein FlhG